jgi:predicted nucleic acid-binding protein
VPTGSRAGSLASNLPGPVYCDARALVKLYVSEPDSSEVNLALVGREDLLVSDLPVTELVSSLGRRRREGRLEHDAAARPYAKLMERLASGIFQSIDLAPAVHRWAALARVSDSSSIATYDRRLAQASLGAGLAVFQRKLAL